MPRSTPPHFRKFVLNIILVLFLLLIPEVRHALADYLGPDRVIITYDTETYDVGVWAKDDPTGDSCIHTYGTDCIVCQWDHDPFSAPCAAPVTADYYWYKTGTETETIQNVTNLPEATISATLQNCNEQNGWCTSAALLHQIGRASCRERV